MTLQASDIITRAGYRLGDSGNATWVEAQMFLWITDAQREICKRRPTTYTVRQNASLVHGTVQTLPTGTFMLLKAHRNMGAGGTTPGDAVFMVDRSALDEFMPSWRSADASATVQDVMYDPAVDVNHYEVYPPQPTTGQGTIECTFAGLPAAITAANNDLVVPDEFAEDLTDYVVDMCLAQESENQQQQKAEAARARFIKQIEARMATDAAYNPNAMGGK